MLGKQMDKDDDQDEGANHDLKDDANQLLLSKLTGSGQLDLPYFK